MPSLIMTLQIVMAPETMTIYELYPGVYQYYIYNYSGSPEITTSNAVVQIYNVSGLQHTLQVPTSGSGLYWYVCDINGSTGNITIRNVIQENAPGNVRFDMPEKPVQPSDVQERTIVSWNWDFGDGTTSTLQNPTKVYNAVGSYNVSLTVSDGSSQSTEVKEGYIVVGGSSVDENSLTSSLVLYPVPAHDQLHIESDVSINSLRITDLSGKEMMQLKIHAQKARLDISDMKQGVYLIFIESDHGNLVKKFTVK